MDSIRRIEELAARKAKAKKAKAKAKPEGKMNYLLGDGGGVTYNNSPAGRKEQKKLAELYREMNK